MSSSKRSRGEEPEKRGTQLELEQLLALDPELLTRAAKDDAGVLAELSKFSDNLRASIETVQKELQEEEMAAAQVRAAAKEAAEEEKRKQLLASNTCFECGKSVDILRPCAGFQEGDGCKGVMLCEKCEDKIGVGTCTECSSFLCKECDPSYKCNGCKELFCLPCAEKDDSNVGKSCECGDWYCMSCADDVIVEENCCSCSTESVYCTKCDSNKLERCEGECEEPLCDKCVCKLACGNDARLCGNCEYDCVDCDMCAGYYGASRWT